MFNFYVYSYSTEKDSVFYVGKGKNYRINESHKESPYCYKVLQARRRQGIKIIKKKIYTKMCEKEAFAWETYLIDFYKPKCNLTKGGEGTSGYKHTKETISQISLLKFSNLDDFVKKAKKVHNDKYDYSKAKYKSAKTKIEILCLKHGKFYQNPNNHLQGKGCPKCKGGVKFKLGDFVELAKEVHNDKYDYSKVKYKNAKTHIVIICSKHGEFIQLADSHIRGHGCPKCQYEKLKECFSGEKNWNSRLTWKQVSEIKNKYIPYKYSQNKLAKEYGVSRECIMNIVGKKTWVKGSKNG